MTSIEEIIGKYNFDRNDLLVKAKELNIKGRSKLNKQGLIDEIIYTTTNPQRKYKKQYIPKVLKNLVWDTHIGKEKGIGKCYCCENDIDSKHFECGHIVSERNGGDLSIDNLRPVCSLCNKSIGTKNMNDFKNKYIKSNNNKQNIKQNIVKHTIESKYKTIKWTCLNCKDIFTKCVLKTDNNYTNNNNCSCGLNKFAMTVSVL